MTPADLDAAIEGIAEAISEHMGRATIALSAALDKVTELEQRLDVTSSALKELVAIGPPENAYQIAVRRGFVGDVDAWLASLKGEKGDQGLAGNDGRGAPPVDLKALAAEAAALVPAPLNGKDGKDAEVDMAELAAEAAALVIVPTPKDGQDGAPGRDGAPGKDGTSVTPKDLEPMILDAVGRAVSMIPIPKDGRDGIDGKDGKDAEIDYLVLDEFIKDHLLRWPKPKDGASVTVEDVAPLIKAEVEKSFAALPPPKDPVSIAQSFIDRDGVLVFTLTDGSTRSLGPVVGRDGLDVDMESVRRQVEEAIAQFPVPKDGRDGADGLGFDDLDFSLDEQGRTYACFTRGDVVKRVRIISLTDQGVYRDGTEYLRGDGVTYGGSFWIAQADTNEKPGDGKTAWRLTVKKGADGKPGQKGDKGDQGPPGQNGRPGHDLR